MRVEIVDVRPIEAATPRGTMERRHLVYYRIDGGPTQSLEVPLAEITRETALEAIAAHLKWRDSIIGESEL